MSEYAGGAFPDIVFDICDGMIGAVQAAPYCSKVP